MVVGVSGLRFPTFTSNNVSTMTFSFEGSMGIAARRVDKLGLDIRSFKEPLKRAVKEVIIPSIQMNFHKFGRPRWAPLSDETESRKGHARPLHLTGALRSTMKQIGIWHIDQEKALIPNLPDRIWYGVIHQTGIGDPGAEADMWFDPVVNKMVNVGDSGDGRNIPARPFAVIQPEDEENIERVFGEWLEMRIERAGLGPARRA